MEEEKENVGDWSKKMFFWNVKKFYSFNAKHTRYSSSEIMMSNHPHREVGEFNLHKVLDEEETQGVEDS
jgi:hypothetical protein